MCAGVTNVGPTKGINNMLNDLFADALSNQGFANFEELIEACNRIPAEPDPAAFANFFDEPASASLN